MSGAVGVIIFSIGGSIGFVLGAWWVATRVERMVDHINSQSKEWQ